MKVYVIKWADEVHEIFLRKADAHQRASYFPEDMKSAVSVEAYELKEIV